MMRIIHSLLAIEINGDSLYLLTAWFFIYSFFGWIWETCYMSIKEKKYTNRGFVFGPCITLYGCGAMTVYLILKPISDNTVLLYFVGLLVATTLEYITAVIMETLFHTSWWDYSNDPFNFQGRICLVSSLFWGVLSVLLFRVFQPFVTKITAFVSIPTGINILLVVIAFYLLDFTTTCIGASTIAEKLRAFNDVLDDFSDYIKKSKIGTSAGDIKNKVSYYKSAVTRNAAYRRLRRGEKEISQLAGRIPEVKDNLLEKFGEFKEKYLKVHRQSGMVARRFMRNYPKLGRGYSLRHKKETEEKSTSKEE